MEDAGVHYQAGLFRRDYKNGDAIAERYLALVRSPKYATTCGRQDRATFRDSGPICRPGLICPSLGLPDGPPLEGRRVTKAFEVKILRTLEIFPGGREMSARKAFNKVKRMGYDWDEKVKVWQKL